MTQWRLVPNFPNYEVSDEGYVRNSRSGRILMGDDSAGHTTVSLRQDGRTRTLKLYLIVVDVFLDPAPGLGWGIRHIDGDIYNCSVENLEWTKEPDRRHRPRGLPIRILETDEIFLTERECADRIGVTVSAISKHLSGLRSSVGGYHLEMSAWQ